MEEKLMVNTHFPTPEDELNQHLCNKRDRIAELEGAQELFANVDAIAIDLARKYYGSYDLETADYMSETRQERVEDAVDAAYPRPDNAAD
jgi:hypothetical protein